MTSFEIDRQTSAMYIHLTDNEIVKTVEMPTGEMGVTINVDVDGEGKAVGVEII